jgi:hypothetical protein
MPVKKKLDIVNPVAIISYLNIKCRGRAGENELAGKFSARSFVHLTPSWSVQAPPEWLAPPETNFC